MPLLPDIYHVDETLLVGTDGLWRAAVRKTHLLCDAIFMLQMMSLPRQARDKHRESKTQKEMMRFTQVGSANADVARLAQKLLLKLECTVMEAAACDATAATASPGGGPLQREHSGGQSQLIQRVKVGLAQALADAEAGAVSAYVSVLQLFVDKYRGNAMRRAHASSVRGVPIELRVDFTPLSNVHSNTTAAAVYAQVAALRAAEPPDADEMETVIADGEGEEGAAAAAQAQPAFLLKNPKGGQQLPRNSMQTMAELGVQSGCVMRLSWQIK
eukprot:COSAG06_NODE_3179_length_5724_cov_88.554489_1_plen_272_part_00